MQKIKTCPFCGGNAEKQEETMSGGHGMYYTMRFVKCLFCGANGPKFETYYDGDKDEVEAWNKRIKELS
jgi:Lar family restriction alleviation protein